MRYFIPLATAAAVLAIVGCNSQPGPGVTSAQAGADPAGPGAAGPGATGGTTTSGSWLRELYVSPSGSDTADGSSAHPFQTIGQAIARARPGDRITVRSGTYAEHVLIDDSIAAGTSDAPIRLQGDGSMPKIVPDPRQTATLLQISRPHWQVAAFEFDVQGQPSYAVAFTGDVTGSVLSDSNLHGGTSGAGVSAHMGADGATIEHNEIAHFWRSSGGGVEDSHGVIVQPSTKNISIRYNKIHENSGDAVQCLWEADVPGALADNIRIEHNEMYSDYEQAVDIKKCTNVLIRDNYMHDYLATSPGGNAIVVHVSASDVTIEGNRIVNVGKAIAIGGNRAGPVPYNVVVRRNKISHVYKGENLEGVGIRIENSESAQVLNNTFEDVAYAGIMVGGGDQGATSNLTVKNNIVTTAPGGVSMRVGSQAPGLVSDYNLFGGSVAFSVSGATIPLSAWQAKSEDTHSKAGDPQLAADTLVPGAAAIDAGADVGLPYCGGHPDIGAVETGNCQAIQ